MNVFFQEVDDGMKLRCDAERPNSAVRFVRNFYELKNYLLLLKQIECPHCGAVGFLIGHGWLLGFFLSGARDNDAEQRRGRRIFCSNRFRRMGCGRTFSVLLSSCLRRRQASAPLLFRFLRRLRRGMSRQSIADCRLRIESTFYCTGTIISIRNPNSAIG